MAIKFHPAVGTILICDFKGFVAPEMEKRRPVVVVSPRFRNRTNLCAVVPLSTTPPRPVEPYHHKLVLDEPLPAPYDAGAHWVKADMIYTVSFARLYLPSEGKDEQGKRVYDARTVTDEDLLAIRKCILHSIGISNWTGPG